MAIMMPQSPRAIPKIGIIPDRASRDWRTCPRVIRGPTELSKGFSITRSLLELWGVLYDSYLYEMPAYTGRRSWRHYTRHEGEAEMRACILFLVILLAAGCGRRQTVVFDHPPFPEGGQYEIVWVDPELVFFDTLFTLIRSERIDSLYVEISDPSTRLTPSIRFHIPEAECNVAVNLVDAHYQPVMPLLVRRLGTGWYKLTFNLDRFSMIGNRSDTYYLQADFCGRSVRKAFVDR